MSITAEMAKNIVETGFEAFDAAVIERARERIIDVVGCALAGVHASGCAMLLDLMLEWGGKKEGTVLGLGDRMPAPQAAMVNSVLARSYDFEPTGALIGNKSTPSHISGTTVPVALTAGEARAASGRDVLTAMILGDDLAVRIVAASQLNIDSGWDSTGTVNVFGATAIAGRLWGLNEGQMVNALGLAMNQMGGTFLNIFDYSHAFKLPQGLAARAGIFSAALAKKGFTAPGDVLTGKQGYFALYCKDYTLDILTKDLGRKFYAADTFKPYPCCRSNHAAVECTLSLVNKHAIKPGDVEEIVVDVSRKAKDFAVGQPFHIGAVPQINAAFSLQYTVASAFLRKTMRLEHFTDDSVCDPAVSEIATKVHVESAMPSDAFLGASVTIKTKQGKKYEARVEMPKGSDTFTPLSKEEKREKFRTNVAFSNTVTAERADEALGMLERLETIDDVTKIIKLLVPQ
jgi:2-methylcitrate dehydratase PrpD